MQALQRSDSAGCCGRGCLPMLNMLNTKARPPKPPSLQDAFYASQMLRSPLRVPDLEAADVVWVPILTKAGGDNEELEQQFMQEAPQLLPALGRTPHVLVLSHPLTTHVNDRSPLLLHDNARHFTFLTIVVQDFWGNYTVCAEADVL